MTYNDELYHYGVLGMKWGKRRYTNRDGSLNELGRKRKAMQDANAKRKNARDEYGNAVRKNKLLKEYGMGSAKDDIEVGKAAKASEKAKAEYKQAKYEYQDIKRKTVAEARALKSCSKGRAAVGNIMSTLGGAALGTAATVSLAAVGSYKVMNWFLDLP